MKGSFRRELFDRLPVIGILRGFRLERTCEIVKASLEGGLTNLELTMNTPNATSQIREAIALAEGKLNVGAGTVTDAHLLKAALDAGASFIVTPTLVPEVVSRCVRDGVPVFPGALSPTEVVRAWEMGATMVKIFPAEVVGPAYIRSLKAPFPQIKLLPTGGVDLATLSEYVKAGADGFGVGSPLFDRKRIEADDWNWVEVQCRAFSEHCRR